LQTQNYVDDGFTFVPSRGGSFSEDMARLTVRLTGENGALVWRTSNSPDDRTPGYIDGGQDLVLWYLPPLGGVTIDPGDAPAIDVVISEIDMTLGRIYFKVRTKDIGTPVENGDYKFRLKTSTEVVAKTAFEDTDSVDYTGATAPADGEFGAPIYITIPSGLIEGEGNEVRFFIIEANSVE
ncbi:MAG: hypothetical protein FWG05_06150, partial [Kiritimatiellaeota bacterium]|nr:hypothetical protein [Kiritimatiellota bacterium]